MTHRTVRPGALLAVFSLLAGLLLATGSASADSEAGAAAAAEVQAAADPGSYYRAMDPRRVLDTRSGIGTPTAGPVGPEGTVTLQVTGPEGSGLAPVGATAVMLNVTAMNGTSSDGWISVYPTGYADGPNTSNLNVASSRAFSNVVVTKVSATGTVTLYNARGTTDLVAELQGYYTADAGSLYRPVDPRRILDTRSGTGAPAGVVGPKGTLKLQVTGPDGSGLAPVGSVAVVLNVTATHVSDNTSVAVYPTGYAAGPDTPNLYLVPGLVAPNLVVSKVAADGSVTLYNASGTLNLIADLQGYYATDAGSLYTPNNPLRVLDTRQGVGVPAGSVGPEGTVKVKVTGPAGSGLAPEGSSAVVLNVTATHVTAETWISVYPTGYADGPNSSNLNLVPGDTLPNLVVTKVAADGTVTLQNARGSVSLIADLQGAYAERPQPPAPTYSLQVSDSASRAAAVPLEGRKLSTPSYVFLGPETGVQTVAFYLDNPAATGTPTRMENTAPFDFVGGTAEAALPWDLKNVSSGSHTITAVVALAAGGTTKLTSTFTVDNTVRTLKASPSSLTLTGEVGKDIVQGTTALSASDSSNVPVTITSDAAWLTGEVTGLTTPTDLVVRADPAVAGAGAKTGTLTVSAPGYASTVVSVAFSVAPQGGWPVDMVYSTSVERTNPQPLNGKTVSGVIYPYVSPEAGVSSVRFYVDNPTMTGTPTRTDTAAPFDLAGSTPGRRPNPWDSALVADGPHTITVVVDLAAGGSKQVDVAFVTANDTNSIVLGPGTINLALDRDDLPQTRDLTIEATKPGTAVTLSSNAGWLQVPAEAVTAPGSARITIDPAGLDPGTFNGVVTARAAGAFTATTEVRLTIGDPGGCFPVACSLVKAPTPYTLDFLYDSGRALDVRGIGTGFTKVLAPEGQTGYDRSKISTNLNAGTLSITTDAGVFTDKNQKNAIGVGFDGPRPNTTLATTLVDVPKGAGKFEQAGLWFGYNQKNVMKFVVMSTPTGTRIQHQLDVDGVVKYSKYVLATVGNAPLTLSLTTDAAQRTVTARYRIGDGTTVSLGAASVPGEFFSFDAAGIDPTVGTRSFAGIMASHRNAVSPLTYTFDNFLVTADAGSDNLGEYVFKRSSYDSPYPTAMEFGPDGKLYVVNLMGQLRRLTIDSGNKVVGEQLITTLGQRLALGLTIDPASTPDNVVVWIAHSSPSVDAGEVNSGAVTKLSGPNLENRNDVITGLPRSIANHSTNAVRFGKDGKLYVAQGGNTGAGGANAANTEFGDRAEQPLSAALLVADVKAPDFDGTCANTEDMYGPAPCDVRVWASGLRNAYSFAVHSNGRMYAVNNGLGVVGSYPPSATAPCKGLADTKSWKVGGNNPGNQNDTLDLLVEGKYYGTPNPSRDECVFKDGSYQGVAPLPNYQPPLWDLGPNTSTDGIIEYQGGNAFCGDLNGDLLVSNYSVGDNINWLKLNDDGTQVLSSLQVAGELADPLPLALGPNGTVWVGEFGGGKITAMQPEDRGCWSSEPALPTATLDAGGTAIGDKIFVVGGKVSSSDHRSTLHVYDATAKTWSTGAPMPGLAVENPAVTSYDGKLYVFGGGTEAFAGATTQAFSYDPVGNSWTALPAMPQPRAGATAQVVGAKAYVIGGTGASDESLSSVSVLDIAAGTWSGGPAMLTPRDNPGSAVLDGRIYVFGGRHKLADGTELDATMTSVEMLDVPGGTWTAKKDMPTGRRTMVVGVLNGRAVVVGGEARKDGNAFNTSEEYDPVTDTWRTLRSVPTPRHGAVGGVVDGRFHVIGGGPKAGAAFTAAHEVLRPPPL